MLSAKQRFSKRESLVHLSGAAGNGTREHEADGSDEFADITGGWVDMACVSGRDGRFGAAPRSQLTQSQMRAAELEAQFQVGKSYLASRSTCQLVLPQTCFTKYYMDTLAINWMAQVQDQEKQGLELKDLAAGLHRNSL